LGKIIDLVDILADVKLDDDDSVVVQPLPSNRGNKKNKIKNKHIRNEDELDGIIFHLII